MYSYGRGWIHDETAEELHADDGVDEEEHAHQHAHVGQGLQQQHHRYNSAQIGGAARLLGSFVCCRGPISRLPISKN